MDFHKIAWSRRHSYLYRVCSATFTFILNFPHSLSLCGCSTSNNPEGDTCHNEGDTKIFLAGDCQQIYPDEGKCIKSDQHHYDEIRAVVAVGTVGVTTHIIETSFRFISVVHALQWQPRGTCTTAIKLYSAAAAPFHAQRFHKNAPYAIKAA